MQRQDRTHIARRLDRLERQNRRLRRTVLGLATGAVAFALTGFSRQDDVVWGRQFVLVDRAGDKRAELAVTDDGAPMLTFFDSDGRARAELGTTPANSGLLRFRARGGTTRYLARLTSTGATMSVFDRDGTRVAFVGTDEDGRPRVQLGETDQGDVRLDLRVDEGEPRLELLDDRGSGAVRRPDGLEAKEDG